MNRVIIDIAFLCQEYSSIELEEDSHIIQLDEIDIKEDVFKSIFYPCGESFGMDKANSSKKEIFPYISFLPPHRTVNGKLFSLLDQIYRNIETDLNISRNCFTTCSNMELANELTNIRTLCDLKSNKLMGSLPWSNVLNIIRDNYLVIASLGKEIQKPILVVSVVFVNPNKSIKPTIIKFNYRITLDSTII
jgi:hypothetical protein